MGSPQVPHKVPYPTYKYLLYAYLAERTTALRAYSMTLRYKIK